MLVQNHREMIPDFYGLTTSFRKSRIKPGVTILADEPGAPWAKYLHGEHGQGTWTFYGGHDPEDPQHQIGDAPDRPVAAPALPGVPAHPQQRAVPGREEEGTQDVTMTRRGRLLLGLLLFPCAAAAQAPRITPAGDPSVQSDSIYRLAVDPRDHPDESAVFLLDDGVIVVEADGRESRTFRQVVQVLKQSAVEGLAEHSFSWSPDNERFTLNWIRVVRPDGSVVSAGPAQQQESDVPAAMGAPVYANRKVLRVSLSGVAVGTIVDYSTTTVKTRAWVPGDFYQWWGVSTGLSVQRSRLIVDAPASEALRIKERNLNFARQTTRAGDRQVLTWATGGLKQVESEAYAADSNDIYMSVALSSPLTWGDIGRWYGGLAADRYALPPDLAARVRAMVSGARSARDTAAVVQRWVAQDIRYVSIALGIGGYQPRTPAEVVASGFGDCKDKATLFVAALRSLGFDAVTVLASSSGGVDRALPSMEQFDHAIAYVSLPEGRVYTDLTVALLPLGLLPPALQGEFGLAVPARGAAEELTFPQETPAERLSLIDLSGRLDADGRFHGAYAEEMTGSRQWELRDAFETPMDSAGRANFARRIAQGWFPGAKGDSLRRSAASTSPNRRGCRWRCRTAGRSGGRETTGSWRIRSGASGSSPTPPTHWKRSRCGCSRSTPRRSSARRRT